MRKVKKVFENEISLVKRGVIAAGLGYLGYWKVGLEWPYNTPPGQ